MLINVPLLYSVNLYSYVLKSSLKVQACHAVAAEHMPVKPWYNTQNTDLISLNPTHTIHISAVFFHNSANDNKR